MAPQRRRRAGLRAGSNELFILIVIAVIALIVVTQNHDILARAYEKLYSGTSALIAVIMLIEYLLLRGADRSDIFQREIETRRAQRRDDLLAMRGMETELVELRSRLATELAQSPPGAGDNGRVDPAPMPADVFPNARASIEDARATIERVIAQLRARI